MHLRYDDDFVEGAVFLCAGGRRRGAPALQVRRFHAEREKCYSVADPDERNAAFFQVHFGWFREWGLEELITCSLREFPLLPDALQVLAFRQARNRNEEGAELYVGAGDVRTAVVALRLERLMRDDQMLRFLRHEFTHLHDMVDPVFAYSAQIALRVQNPTQQRIVRERYRLLWDVTIDGRLARNGREPMNHRDQHQALFNRAFSFWSEEKRRQVFDAHWEDLSPRHENILALAADPRDLDHAREPLPGGSCPLCQFPTFEWADARRLTPETVAAASALFPDWTPEQSACK
ncbi:MAG TPA: hypothetical protein VMS21_14975, partial [Methylomirabilota bacterium]|nr:hypothetical protein [Methylomirabilota bacterium]